MRRWLVNRGIAIQQETSIPAYERPLQEAINAGVDFSGLYHEFGLKAEEQLQRFPK